MNDNLLREYYACFNERRLGDVEKLLEPDALFEHIPFGDQGRGIKGYIQFAVTWLSAFPDAAFTIQKVDQQSENMFDVHLLAKGKHLGTFDVGVFKFKPTRIDTSLPLRELVNVPQGKIRSSTLSFDLNELISQLATVDYHELHSRLERIRQLTDELLRASGDAARQREIANRLGPELDAARRAVRPHYSR